MVVGLEGLSANFSVQNGKQFSNFKIMFTKISKLLCGFIMSENKFLGREAFKFKELFIGDI